MPDDCVANLDSILTVPKSLLSERIALLTREKMTEVREAALFPLDLDR
jgi:mRNA-degrading endonuclease toxin of MazEF toxin-antitoxin module